tara:strand:- start:202 stop:408 length:207 start_codon:yes stop_codon:yes gene_type:complete
MKKFNGFENHLLQDAIKLYVEKAEDEVLYKKASLEVNKRLLFAPGYFTMIGEELSDKVNDMTLKKHLK